MARRRNRPRGRFERPSKAGMPPGAAVYIGPERSQRVHVHVIDYDKDGVREVDDPSPDKLQTYRSPRSVTWIDVDGVHDVEVVQAVSAAFGLHSLWVEDILNPQTRPKVDQQGELLLLILRSLHGATDVTTSEQVALVLGDGFVISFQERPGDEWSAVRARIRDSAGRIRAMGSDFLLHALVDVTVDAYFGVVQGVEEKVDALEDQALETLDRNLPAKVLALKSELALLRAAAWPVREAVGVLMRGQLGCVRPETVPFFRDLDDHLAQVLDAVEADRERLLSSIELHLAMTNQQLNEVIRVLTVVSTIFLPLMFMSSLWGMNFKHMPELEWTWGYEAALALMASVGVGMYVWFRRQRLL
jgi:magnesium transporter